MRISFCIPHVFQTGSNPAEDKHVSCLLKGCLDELTLGSAKTHVVPTLTRTGQTRVTFDMPHVFHSESIPEDNASALQSLLHCLCGIDTVFCQLRGLTSQGGMVPPLYTSGVYYDRTQIWDTTPALYKRGFGDCKSLSAALIGEYACQGIACNPVFRWAVTPDGTTNYHILVQTPLGFEDPSKVLGMGQNENAYFRRTG